MTRHIYVQNIRPVVLFFFITNIKIVPFSKESSLHQDSLVIFPRISIIQSLNVVSWLFDRFLWLTNLTWKYKYIFVADRWIFDIFVRHHLLHELDIMNAFCPCWEEGRFYKEVKRFTGDKHCSFLCTRSSGDKLSILAINNQLTNSPI